MVGRPPTSRTWLAPTASEDVDDLHGEKGGRVAGLEQETAGTTVERGGDLLVGGESGEHEHAGARDGAGDFGDRGEAVEDRHDDVEQRDVGAVRDSQFDGLTPVGRLSDDLDLRIGGDSGAGQRFVVGEVVQR